MGERFEALIQGVESRIKLESVPLDPALSAPATNERGVRIHCYNWRADLFEKISMMDTSVVVPPMQQLNAIFYPRPNCDAPIFLFLTVITKSNIIAIFNVCCPFKDSDYVEKYVDPLLPILDSYRPFTGKHRNPDWFEKYRTPATVFGVYSKKEIAPITDCGLALLDRYLESTATSSTVDDKVRLKQIKTFQDQFRADIQTKDLGRKVLEKLTDEETAHRIFHEVAT